MTAEGRIEAKPEFRSLSEAEVRAALADLRVANPTSLEVGRLMVAFVERLRTSDVERTSEDLLRALPEVRAPIEAVALHYAIRIMGDPGLLAVLQGVIPELKNLSDNGDGK